MGMTQETFEDITCRNGLCTYICPWLLCALCVFEDIMYNGFWDSMLFLHLDYLIYVEYEHSIFFYHQSVTNYRKILNSCACNKVDLAFLVWLLGCISRGILLSLFLIWLKFVIDVLNKSLVSKYYIKWYWMILLGQLAWSRKSRA